MTHEQIAIIALLAAQAFTLTMLWLTKEERDWFRNAWIRDSMDLLDLKRERN